MKQCTRKDKCINPLGSILPKTLEYFNKMGNGLSGECRICKNARDKEYHSRPEVKAARRKRDSSLEAKQVRKERQRTYYAKHKDDLNAQKRERRATDPDFRATLSGYARRFRERHPDRIRDWKRSYTAQRAERLATDEHYREEYRLYVLNRRARRKALPNGFSPQDWNDALRYFGGVCAVCGRAPSKWLGLARDHWMPLSKGGGTTKSNIVPLCHSRQGIPQGLIGGCNNSKLNKHPEEWVRERFDSAFADDVLQRISNYFATVSRAPTDTNTPE